MTGRGKEFEQPRHQELSSDPRVINALRGKISEPIQTISHKQGSEGQLVEVRITEKGVGMFGLTDWKDNKEWSGMTNHVLLSARYSTYFAQRMAEKGYDVNPQRILNGMIVSHAGRRQWDEAGWYPEVVENANEKRKISNEILGLRLIQGKVPQDAFDLVFALAHGDTREFSVDPSIYDSLDFKIAIYVDHRTTQKYEPLHTRMGDFLLGNFFKKEEVTPELKERVYTAVGNIVEKQKDYRLRKSEDAVSLEEADQIAERLGADIGSDRLPRKDLMQLILNDADTEAELIQAGINPNAVNDQTVPMPKWEDKFRKDYVQSSEESIKKRIHELNEALRNEDLYGSDSTVQGVLKRFELDFPTNTWWGQYARKLT